MESQESFDRFVYFNDAIWHLFEEKKATIKELQIVMIRILTRSCKSKEQLKVMIKMIEILYAATETDKCLDK